jgi:ABC-2 type transport system ATP-binding protein
MRIVLGVLAGDAGEVRWQGRPVDATVRARIGYMPEERGLYPKMRVRDQLVHLARLHGASRRDAEAATDHWVERLGLSDRAGDRVEALSLGNQQRVQLAAALVHAPDLLVLDEPFAGLDPVGVDVLAEALAERVREDGVPVVFSSHQLELVERLCDVVGIIAAGSMVAVGRVDELRARRTARQWQLRMDPDPPDEGWLSTLPGVRLVERRDGAALIEVSGDVDDQAVLHAALAQGRVQEFRQVRATLTDLFREAVAP